ncbi:hypothetical protein AA313_de0209396 [Arthrobotrys entomopaga]|nr:hypothetical protein AA313_de0209396 [Arthrobotrys entomopaga]
MPRRRYQKSDVSPTFQTRQYSTTTAPATATATEDIQELGDTGGVLVIGGVGLDLIGTPTPKATRSSSRLADPSDLYRVSNPGSVSTHVGGVAKNVATTISQLDKNSNVRLVSAIGKDLAGISILQDLQNLGLDLSEIKVSNQFPTAKYLAINSEKVKGGLAIAVAGMDIIKNIPKDVVKKVIEKRKPRLVCFDGNLSPTTIKALCDEAKLQGAIVVCEPTSRVKAGIIGTVLLDFACSSDVNRKIDIISPNELELASMQENWIKATKTMFRKERMIKTRIAPSFFHHRRRKYKTIFKENTPEFCKKISTLSPPKTTFNPIIKPDSPLSRTIIQSIHLLQAIDTILIKLGENGVLAVRNIHHPDQIPGPEHVNKESPTPTPHHFQAFEKYTGVSTEEAEKIPEEEHPAVHASMYIPVAQVEPTDFVIGVQLDWWPAPKLLKPKEVVNSNGAGDSFLGGFVQGMLSAKDSEEMKAERKLKPWEFCGDEYLRVLVEKGQKVALSVLKTNESHFMADKNSSSVEENSKGREDIDLWKTTVAMFGEFEDFTVEETEEEGGRARE